MSGTALVIGAGASTDFGNFPVGSSLAEQIEARLTQDLAARDGPVISALSRHGGFNQVHSKAMTRIVRGLQSRDSIDQFVDDCRDDSEVGTIAKLAIAHCILDAERMSRLAKLGNANAEVRLRSFRDSWLGQICRLANPDVSPQQFPLFLANTSFVTFNYDPCIERYLLYYASETLAQPIEKVGKFVCEIPILHSFGQLGTHTFLGAPATAEVEFGTEDPRYLSRAASGIKTFTEELESQHGDRVRKIIASAQTVVFLGFQYHQPNMRLLFEDGAPRGKRIFGTTFGMSARQQSKVESGFTENGNTAVLIDLKCDDFIRRYGEDIFEH